MKKIILSILFAIFSITIFAQTDSTETLYIPDHPGYTYNALLVGVNRADIEFGVGYGNPYNLVDENYEPFNMLYNTTYVRYGVCKHFEFRFGMEYGFDFKSKNYGMSGFNIGAKIPIITDVKNAPNIAVIATTYIPNTGVAEVGGQFPHYAPNVTLAVQKCYFNRLVLFGNAGIYYDGFDINTYEDSLGNVTSYNHKLIQYNVSFAPYFFITDNWGVFVESVGRFTGGWENDFWNGDKSMWLWDAGTVYYITPNLQWDLSFGTNYRTGFDNSFVNSGICWRIKE